MRTGYLGLYTFNFSVNLIIIIIIIKSMIRQVYKIYYF